MDQDNHVEIAACGLDCGPCPLRRAPFDKAAANQVVEWFKSEGWLADDEGVDEIIERAMYCKGCHGSHDTHWSADCWIMECCIEERQLNNCSECNDFPCQRLEDWSKQNEHYGKALERLSELHQTAKG